MVKYLSLNPINCGHYYKYIITGLASASFRIQETYVRISMSSILIKIGLKSNMRMNYTVRTVMFARVN
jgi:hypothetical protein